MYKTREHHLALGNELGDFLMEKEALLVETVGGGGVGIAGNRMGAKAAREDLKRKGYSDDQIDLADLKTRGKAKAGLSGFGHTLAGSALGGILGGGRVAPVVAGAALGLGAGYVANRNKKRNQMIEKARSLRGRQVEVEPLKG